MAEIMRRRFQIRRIVERLKRPFNYLCYFNSNVERLRDEATKLADARARVTEVQRNAEENMPEVEVWLGKNTRIQADLSKLEGDIAKFGNGCLNMKSRYVLSKKARITAKAVEDLRASTEEILRRGASIGLYSRKEMEEAIMEDLRGGDRVHTIGISGMSGIGKTTMAKNIMDRVREKKLFEEVVMVQQVDILRIQSEIAEVLGLRLREESLSSRAHKLHARLTMWPMRILLIFDDVREVLTLEDILGIPCSMFFTVVLTSENENVLREMSAKRHAIKRLSEAEAWFLFRKIVGTWINGSDLFSLAKELVKECKGLPLALTIVGAKLQDERNKHIWEDALRQLKEYDQLRPHIFYSPISLSYKIFDEDTKSLFILCSLFPEGYDIHLKYLTMCCIGLHMFAKDKSVKSVEEARNKVRTAFKMLKAHALLLDGRDENHVRMHDFVRHSAKLIAYRDRRVTNRSNRSYLEGYYFYYKCFSVHGDEINKLPIQLNLPDVRLLKIDNYSKETEVSTVDPDFFQGMIELNVLSFRSIRFRSLPETTQLLKNLRTLYLDGCTSLETIYIVGKLSSLEILICRSCDMISELPVEIGRLTKLRMLEVHKCRRVKRIARGVISNLVGLEELMITESFNEWERVGYGERSGNAAISEIEHLENLTRLEIEIGDSTVAAETFHEGVYVKYQIRFGGSHLESCEPDRKHGFAGWIKDIVDVMILLYYEINEISESYLRLRRIQPDHFFYRLGAIEIYDCCTGSLFHSLINVNLLSLKELRISKCRKMIKVIENDDHRDQHLVLFPSLHNLYLEDLPELESFGWSCELALASLEKVWIKGCHRLEFFDTQNVRFRSLKKVVIIDCNRIRSLFPASVALSLDNLRTLSITRCKEMVQVMMNDNEQSHILFRFLEEVELRDLPKLQSFYSWKCELELPSLKNVCIYSCPLWKKFSIGSLSKPNLKRVEINSKVIDVGSTPEW